MTMMDDPPLGGPSAHRRTFEEIEDDPLARRPRGTRCADGQGGTVRVLGQGKEQILLWPAGRQTARQMPAQQVRREMLQIADHLLGDGGAVTAAHVAHVDPHIDGGGFAGCAPVSALAVFGGSLAQRGRDTRLAGSQKGCCPMWIEDRGTSRALLAHRAEVFSAITRERVTGES